MPDNDAILDREAAQLADADLVLRTRSGDSRAFGELWQRHYRSGITVARNVSPGTDADDLVQEAYTRIYKSILAGGGPTGSFRAYLFTSIRNTAAAWGRSNRETALDTLDTVEDPASSEQATADALDRSLTHRAFKSLPSRWQEVLWYSEIERMKPAEIAPLLGMKATAVAQLTFRAREGLREAWIQAHLQSLEDGSACQWTVERLGAYARNNIGARDRAKLDAHLRDCARCTIVAAEAHEVGNRLALVLLPLTVGVAGTAGYLASLQGAGAPIVALAAMPSTVIDGAVNAGGAVLPPASGAGLSAPVDPFGSITVVGAGQGSTAGASSTTGGTAGALSGAGATVGLVAAGVVVVAAVVASAFAFPFTPTTQGDAASAGESAGASLPSITLSEEADAPNASTRPPTVPSPDDVRAPEASPPQAAPPSTTSPNSGITESDSDAPSASAPGGAEGSDPAPVTPAPESDPAPDPAPEPTEPTPTDPEPTDPEPTDPEPTDPEPVDPAPTDPAPETGEPDTLLPSGTPQVARATASFSGSRLTLTIPVSGDAGSTVRVTFAGSSVGDLVLDGGQATVSVRPTLAHLLSNAKLTVQYVTIDDAGPTRTVPLSSVVHLRDLIAAMRD